MFKRILLQIKYLLGIQIRPKKCKKCGTIRVVSLKGVVSYYTPPGASVCPKCAEYVTIIDDRKASKGYC